jgi:hypothetical protein
MRVCQHCSRELADAIVVERTSGCPYCHSDLKCCLNCMFFDPGLNNQCREPQAEWQSEKARANFCEFFSYRQTSAIGRPGGGSSQSQQDRARSAFDALFKKP